MNQLFRSPIAARLRAVTLAIAVVAGSAACGTETTPAATADATPADTATQADAQGGTDAAPDAAGADTAGADTAGQDAAEQDTPSPTCAFALAPAGTSSIVVNEVQGKGDDWVELRNNGAQAVSLAGLILADGDGAGCARLDAALTFPAEATIPAGGYVLIVGGKTTPAAGLQTKCVTGGPAECWHASFKVSATAGDAIFLVQGKSILDTTQVPPGALTGDTTSWGRVPDGTGKFQVAAPTPGAANKP